MTRGIAAEIGLEIQLFLWSMIDRRKERNVELDYFQIFEMSVENENGVKIQKVIHRQERPNIKDIYYISVETPINGKIWVIDSDDYSTMMFPSEY